MPVRMERCSSVKILAPPQLPPTQPTAPEKREHDPKVVQAARGMESMFLNQLMQVMRKTVESSEMSLENAGTAIYRSLLDAEFAERAAATGGVGFADLIVESLESRGYNSRSRPQQVARAAKQLKRTGGTDESSKSDVGSGVSPEDISKRSDREIR